MRYSGDAKKRGKAIMLFISFGVLFLAFNCSFAIAENMVTKEVCLSPFGMNWKTSEEAKSHIITLAKREAVGELFGELIKSITEVQDFQFKRDDIVALSSGYIRTKGIPEYYNGKGFGELCTKINAYVTDEDIVRFKPRTLRKKVCIADPRLSLGEIRQTAERQARIQAIRDFEPTLEKNKDDIILTLIHESKTEDGGFIPETTTYCTTVSGIVFPIELMAVIDKRGSKKSDLDDVVIECWGDDVSDGNIGGWKSRYPHCILDDGGGDSNAIYDGSVDMNDNKLCFKMGNLSTAASPSHTLAVGFRVSLRNGTFSDGTNSKEVEMTRFSGRPKKDAITKCIDF